MESVKKTKEAARKASRAGEENADRIVLRRPEQQRLELWLEQLHAKFEGMVRITKSDLANFLIRRHAEDLTESEVAQIEAEHFDEVRWLNWALGKIREAKRQGVSLTLSELMAKKEAQLSIGKSVNRRTRKSVQKRANQESAEHGPNTEFSLEGPQSPILNK